MAAKWAAQIDAFILEPEFCATPKHLLYIGRRRPPPDLQHSSHSDWIRPMEPQFLSKRNSAAGEPLYDRSRCMIGGGGIDEPICFRARRRVSPVAAHRECDPTGRGGLEKLAVDGQLRETGADRVSRFQRRVERQARRQAERMLERQRPPPASAARAAPVPIIVGRDKSR